VIAAAPAAPHGESAKAVGHQHSLAYVAAMLRGLAADECKPLKRNENGCNTAQNEKGGLVKS
jgi:hypothetical protein